MTATRPADLPAGFTVGDYKVTNPDPKRFNPCDKVEWHDPHDVHDRGASGGWCPGYVYDAREAALASFLATDERLRGLRGHGRDSLYRAAFDALLGRERSDGQDPIEVAVRYWIKEPYRAAYEERLRRHVRSAQEAT